MRNYRLHARMIRRVAVRAKEHVRSFGPIVIGVLPNDLAIGRYLTNARVGAVIYQRVAVRQALCTRNEPREEDVFIRWRILPCKLDRPIRVAARESVTIVLV